MTSTWLSRCGAFFARWFGWMDGSSPREDIDPDVREVFLGELDEVAETLAELLPGWRANPADPDSLQSIRRGFHTLKGSGLMVGARILGEFCGYIEQLSLCLIERRSKASPDMVAIIDEAIRLLPSCSRALHANTGLPYALSRLSKRALQALGTG